MSRNFSFPKLRKQFTATTVLLLLSLLSRRVITMLSNATVTCYCFEIYNFLGNSFKTDFCLIVVNSLLGKSFFTNINIIQRKKKNILVRANEITNPSDTVQYNNLILMDVYIKHFTPSY